MSNLSLSPGLLVSLPLLEWEHSSLLVSVPLPPPSVRAGIASQSMSIPALPPSSRRLACAALAARSRAASSCGVVGRPDRVGAAPSVPLSVSLWCLASLTLSVAPP